MGKLIRGQNNHIKGKINIDCSCNECQKLHEKLKIRFQRRMDLKLNRIFRMYKLIPLFRFTVSIEILIGDSKRKDNNGSPNK